MFTPPCVPLIFVFFVDQVARVGCNGGSASTGICILDQTGPLFFLFFPPLLGDASSLVGARPPVSDFSFCAYTLAAVISLSHVFGMPSRPERHRINSSHRTPWRKPARMRSSLTPPMSRASLLNLVMKSSRDSFSRRRTCRMSAGSRLWRRCWLKCCRNISSSS